MNRGDSAFFDDDVQDALCREFDQLALEESFTIAEFADDTVTIFEISRDRHGTPAPFWWEYRFNDNELAGDTEPDQWSGAMVDPTQFYRRVAPGFIVYTPNPLASGIRKLMPGPSREVPVYQCQESLRRLLLGAMKASPLVLGYELAVLKRIPASRTGPERLALTGHPLFFEGQSRGRRATVRVNIHPTDDDGTTFAVITREAHRSLPRQTWPMRPLQIQAADVPPGRYELTAVLTRPGQVRFQGIPQLAELTNSDRSWDDLEHLVPRQLATRVPVHLVCMVELCGSDDRLQQRIDRLEELVTGVLDGGLTLRVSVVAYGAHGVTWRVDDRGPEIRAWARPGGEAIRALRGLTGRRVDAREYQRAAQLECALQLVGEQLLPTDGRPAIVAAGGRPAHPPGLDTGRQIIPCPYRVDGMSEFARLLHLPEIKFGALRDPKCSGGLWEQLGRDAVATIDDVMDVEGFAASLGLRMEAQIVPFPVIE